MSRYRFTIGPDAVYLEDSFATIDAAVRELARKSRNLPVKICMHDAEDKNHVRAHALGGIVTWVVDCRACNGRGVWPGQAGAKVICTKCGGGGRVAEQ